jgi:hypothetical protein
VAHSLGTFVAYDMLRAYYSRIRKNLSALSALGSEFAELDAGNLRRTQARKHARIAIRRMADALNEVRVWIGKNEPRPRDNGMKAWLVTDFVTLGSPLTHAYYLMCLGKTEAELHDDFNRRARECEFSTCPPLMLDGDNLMSFENPNDKLRYFHHGGQFALTRWTNLYFLVSEVLWGDAIGGPVATIFGDPEKTKIDPALGQYVADAPVYTNDSHNISFFAHTHYRDTK